MGPVSLAVVAAPPRINREDCKRTKHDSHFSKWKGLVGPSDWEDHSLGKEGVARYRVHNLPTDTGPGLYELGIAVSPSATSKTDSDGVVAVYLGQADNVRTRLQRYGRSGAHLNNPNRCDLKREPGFFEDIFSRGYSIVYRWLPMKSKADALKEEAQLLDRFDYAWNKGNNGGRRHDDVLRKLNRAPSSNIQFPNLLRKIIRFSQKQVGINIKETKQLYGDETSNNFFPLVFKSSKSQPKLVFDRHLIIKGSNSKLNREGKLQVEDADSESSISCNRESNHHGSVFESVKLPVAAEKWPLSEGFSETGGVVWDDGSLCTKQGSIDSKALHYNKNNSPEMYKAGRVFFSERSKVSLCYNNICGVEFSDGYFCTSQPVKGRLRCEEHKGLKVSGEHSAQVSDTYSTISSCYDSKYGATATSMCGAPTQNGSCCRRQVKGGGRCWQHSVHKQVYGGPRVSPSLHVSNKDSSISSCYDSKYGAATSMCGAPTQNGSCCRRQVKGGGRCWQYSVHKQVYGGPRVSPSLHVSNKYSSFSSCYDSKYGAATSMCGAPTGNGSCCRRQVKGGGRCWQH